MKSPTRWPASVVCLALLLVTSWPAESVAQVAAPPALVAESDAARTAPLGQALPVDPSVRVGQFADGLRYYIRENQEPANRAELRLAVNVGSIVEDDDQRGLAHFLEHMAFNGTARFEKQELVRFMESIGMRLGPGVNASTSFDETIYMLRLPTDNPDNLTTAFQILEDWAHALTLEDDEIDLERGVVIEEWRLGQGAGSRIRDQQFPVLFGGTRYAERLPIGTLESLQSFDHDALRRFYRDWYRPELMAVMAVGDFDAGAVESLVRRHFENLRSVASARERAIAPVPGHPDTLYSIATDRELPATSVTVYHKMPADNDATIGGYRQQLVENLYNSLLNRRFGEAARQPDAPFLAASSGKGRLIRPVDVYALSARVADGRAEQGLAALLAEAERVARFGFTETELDREKAITLSGIERAYTNRANRNSGSFAAEYIRAFLNGEPIPGIEYEFGLHKRFVPEISLAEVNQVGRRWLTGASRVVLVTGPQKDGVEMPREAALKAVLDAARTAKVTPYLDTVTDQPLLANIPAGSRVVATETHDGGLTEWRLANGIKVALKPTDFDKEQVVFQGFSPGGTSLASDEAFVPATTAVNIIAAGGVGSFNAIDLQKHLAGKVAGVTPYIGAYEEGVRGAGATKDLETLFQLIYLRFTAPRADEAFFQVFTTQSRSQLANRTANPAAVLGDTFTRLMTRDHFRSRPPSVEMLKDLDLNSSLAFYRDRFADASDYTFVFVGDLDPDALKPLVERYLGGLPATGRQETWRDVGLRPPTGVVQETVHRGIAPQSQTRIAFTGPFEFGSQTERTRIAALAQTLQARLRNVLREELGGTYSVGVNAAPAWQPVESYTLTISFGSDPARVEELVTIIFGQIGKMKAGGPPETDVADTRQALRRTFETSLEENVFWLNQLSASYRRGEAGARNILSYPASVDALTPAALREAARRYLNTENYVRVTLLPGQ